MTEIKILPNTKEYQEEMDVKTLISEHKLNGSYGKRIIRAYNEAGFNFVDIDLLGLLNDISNIFPELYNSFCEKNDKNDNLV